MCFDRGRRSRTSTGIVRRILGRLLQAHPKPVWYEHLQQPLLTYSAVRPRLFLEHHTHIRVVSRYLPIRYPFASASEDEDHGDLFTVTRPQTPLHSPNAGNAIVGRVGTAEPHCFLRANAAFTAYFQGLSWEKETDAYTVSTVTTVDSTVKPRHNTEGPK